MIGYYTKEIIYSSLAPSVLGELRKRKPKGPDGKRGHKHYQELIDDFGHPKLKERLAAVIALMRESYDWYGFMRILYQGFPVRNQQFLLDIPLDPPEKSVTMQDMQTADHYAGMFDAADKKSGINSPPRAPRV